MVADAVGGGGGGNAKAGNATGGRALVAVGVSPKAALAQGRALLAAGRVPGMSPQARSSASAVKFIDSGRWVAGGFVDGAT